MAETPSNRRRKGRETFVPGENPMDFQPYSMRFYNSQYYLDDWLDGWKEAEAEWKTEQKEKEFKPTIQDCINKLDEAIKLLRRL